MTTSEPNDIRFAYVDISVFDSGDVRGGVLITDVSSRPFEFRVTSPIKPSQLQKILYGNSLADYMYGELICLPLLKQVKETISLVICRDDHLLVARPNLQFPMVSIRKHESQKKGDSNWETLIRTHKNFSAEQPHAEMLINQLMRQFDIFEPFDRVKMAVSEVHKQKIC